MRDRIADQFKRLDENDRMRRELIGNITHDLHTPLASVQGYLETVLLRSDALDGDTREQHLRTALRHAQRLDRRIADLFELSKLDAGRVQPREEVFCLAELLQDVLQSYRLQAQQRGVALDLAAGSHGQSPVRADIALIERVLQNLVDNALRHTPEGGRVQLAIEPAGNHRLLLRISDTGAGIAAEHLPHIFERYWRGGEAERGDAASHSAGLGLAIVKRIVELHGSAIAVRSAPKQGTTFEFALPQAA
jgi:signal transduction histidine kinase